MIDEEVERLLPTMVQIPAGAFLMGTLDDERPALARRYGGTPQSYSDESPQHEVVVAAFAIAQTPVTNALYAVFQQETGAHQPTTWDARKPVERPDHPVVDISWTEAQALCTWLRKRTGRGYRLPSEAEWEKAARGIDGRSFPWGNTFDAARCNTRESGRGTTTPVGAYPDGASPYGILDMAGNVWEWTQSLQAPYPYRADDGRNGLEPLGPDRFPTGTRRLVARLLRRQARGAAQASDEHTAPESETRRIIRGGCFANPEGFARTACRLRLDTEKRTPFLGIRLACDL